MSYDVYLEAPTGGEPVDAYSRNHTSNTAPMWRKAGADLAEMDGKRARDCGPIIRMAAEKIAADPEGYRDMEPPNRWGTVETTVEFLADIADACDRYPETTIRVS